MSTYNLEVICLRGNLARHAHSPNKQHLNDTKSHHHPFVPLSIPSYENETRYLTFQSTMSHPPQHPSPSPRSASAASSTSGHPQGRQLQHQQNYNSLERNRRRSGSSTGYVLVKVSYIRSTLRYYLDKVISQSPRLQI